MDRKPVASRLIRALGYDLDDSILEVELLESGRIYRYFDVPFSEYREMLDADSLGAYFNDFIRDVYAFEEVEPAT